MVTGDPDRLSWIDRLDWIAITRSASTGFGVLAIGGFTQPLVAYLSPVLGAVWWIGAVLLGSALAGRRIGDSLVGPLQGAVAALFGYGLFVPLEYIATTRVDLVKIAYTAALAVAVGALAGHQAARRRSVGGSDPTRG